MRALCLLLLWTTTLALCLCSPSVWGATEGLQTIVDLQPSRQGTSVRIKGPQGEEGRATLINLNPSINTWYLLQLDWGKGVPIFYHLENENRLTQTLLLDEGNPSGIVIVKKGERSPCDLWGVNSREGLRLARESRLPYAPLCAGRIYLRNPTKGHQTGMEAVTDFLRTKVPGGEGFVTFVRNTFFTYLYQRKAEEKIESKPVEGSPHKDPEEGPGPALLDERVALRTLKPADLGIEIEGAGVDGMIPGAWYRARENPGVFVSVIVPGGIAPEVMRSYTGVVNGLDSVELNGPVYLVAFDLGRFDLKFALGTDHPGVGWSGHILPKMKDKAMAGPDGIATSSPLIRTGIINPTDAAGTVATFTGGFKRYHGAFRYGPLALKNHGTHYGFLEEGVLFSKLQPALSTIYALNDGRVDMKTWEEEDDNILGKIRYARQNGVPIIARFDPATKMSVPGALVNRWGPGNWSGSADEKLRTMRAGAALQEFKGKRFLMYAFFWSATPSAMARVFQAYRCRYAMLLDMNALVHTYLAVYRRQGSKVFVQHLIRGMSEVDMSVKGEYLPRFLGYADDRDFFYLTRKEAR